MLHKQATSPDAVELTSELYWRNAVTTTQLSAVQILDDMVAVNFGPEGNPAEVPLPILTWYIYKIACDLVMIETANSDGESTRGLKHANEAAQLLHDRMEWLKSKPFVDDESNEAGLALVSDMTIALEHRQYYRHLTDQTYNGKIIEPKRIQLRAV